MRADPQTSTSRHGHAHDEHARRGRRRHAGEHNASRGASHRTPGALAQTPLGHVNRRSPLDPRSTMDLRTFDEAGKRFVGTVPSDLPTRPIRAYAGMNSAPTAEARVELVMRELERTGAFRRATILVAVPTGGGHVNPVALELVERMARGDVASCAIQFGTLPSFASFHRVDDASDVHSLLHRRIAQRIRQLYPTGGGPRVISYGESLGAWAGQRMLRTYPGGAGLGVRQLAIDRALWVGVPGFARLSRRSIPAGAMQVVAAPAELEAVRRRRLAARGAGAMGQPATPEPRLVSYSHLDDPVHKVDLSMIWKRPAWLPAHGPKPARVPQDAKWFPLLTFVAAAIDVIRDANHSRPGVFTDRTHDYRAELPSLIRNAYGFDDVGDAELAKITEQVRRSELWIMEQTW